MKYWFFDGSDVTGPFSLKELTQNKSLNEMSLVCPENFSDDGDHWQVAASFDDFKPFFARNAQPDEDTATFEQEMDTLLKESSPLVFDETPSDGPGLQIPKKPAKPGPIEDYFNQVKKEDLGDILGIPNPNENSDLDLAHALEKQLAKTSSTRRRAREQEQESEIDRQTAAELKSASETHHVATATEVFATKAPLPATPSQASSAQTAVLEKANLTMPLVESPTMPIVATPEVTAPAQPTPQPVNMEPEELVVQPAAEVPAVTASEPDNKTIAAQQPSQTDFAPMTDPAQFRREKKGANSIRAGLKQTRKVNDFLQDTQSERIKQEVRKQNRSIVMLLTGLAIVSGLLLMFQLRAQTATEVPVTAQNSARTAQELLTEPAVAKAVEQPVVGEHTPVVPAAAVNAQMAAQEQKALEIVQNHSLSGQRGTLASYLNRIYQSQLAQGYVGSWAAEPLYKNTYIVKYRLTKTRKEPIIYVFQADVAQGKLTGALNNISLDLVGKL